MPVFRVEVHGRLIECHRGSWRAETVLVDGVVTSDRPYAALAKAFAGMKGHEFTITDEAGVERAVDVRVGPGMWSLRMRVFVDGVTRAVATPVDVSKTPGSCANCGYALEGLPIEDGEMRCPECGRHTSAKMAGMG